MILTEYFGMHTIFYRVILQGECLTNKSSRSKSKRDKDNQTGRYKMLSLSHISSVKVVTGAGSLFAYSVSFVVVRLTLQNGNTFDIKV